MLPPKMTAPPVYRPAGLKQVVAAPITYRRVQPSTAQRKLNSPPPVYRPVQSIGAQRQVTKGPPIYRPVPITTIRSGASHFAVGFQPVQMKTSPGECSATSAKGLSLGSIQRYRTFNQSDFSLSPENGTPPIGGVMAFINGALRELTDDGGYISPWNDEGALAEALLNFFPVDDGGHIAYEDNFANAGVDQEDKPSHTVIQESSLPAIARPLARKLLSDGITNLNARQIQRGGKEAQLANVSVAVTPAIPGWQVKYGAPNAAYITTATIETAVIRVGRRQDGRHVFEISRLHWGVRS